MLSVSLSGSFSMSVKREQSGVDKVISAKKQKTIDSFFQRKENTEGDPVSVTIPHLPVGKQSLLHYLTDPDWRKELNAELRKDYFQKIDNHLHELYGKKLTVFPQKELIFNAFNLTPLSEIKVVILGQDPYHNVGQAHGLCFSVPNGIPAPPSLVNIFKELSTDIPDFVRPPHGNLESWAKNGVFLLNATLTVEAHKPNSHANIGWQTFTDAVIRTISKRQNGVVFLLWGNFAQKKATLIDFNRHTIIKAAHPSPMSVVNFFGSKCFSKANNALIQVGKKPVTWNIC